jgi:hypothetical protein
MVKKILAIPVLIISILILKPSFVKADEVVVKVLLDKSVTKYSSANQVVTFAPVRVTLNIENLSDRIQTVYLKPKYHFWLLKASPIKPGVDPSTFMPIVAEGDFTATYGSGYPYVPVQPHSEMQQAYGVLPDAITLRNTYKGYLLPGTYILRVEVPIGLPGGGSYPTTETTLFIVQ